MANQGGSHEQHVKAGQQSHKNSDTQKASAKNEQQASGKDSAAEKRQAGRLARAARQRGQAEP